MVTDRERAEAIVDNISLYDADGRHDTTEDEKELREDIKSALAAVRKERDAEWEAKDLYTHDDMDCACENGRLEERAKWNAAAEDAQADLGIAIDILEKHNYIHAKDMRESRDALNALIEEARP